MENNISVVNNMIMEEQVVWMEIQIESRCGRGSIPTPNGSIRDYRVQLIKKCRSIDGLTKVCPKCNGEKKYEREGHDTIDYLFNPDKYNCMNCGNTGRVDGELRVGLDFIEDKYMRMMELDEIK